MFECIYSQLSQLVFSIWKQIVSHDESFMMLIIFIIGVLLFKRNKRTEIGVEIRTKSMNNILDIIFDYKIKNLMFDVLSKKLSNTKKA